MTGRRPVAGLWALCCLWAACRDANESPLELSAGPAPVEAAPGEAAPAAFPALGGGGGVLPAGLADPAGPAVRFGVSRLVQFLMAGGVLEEVQAQVGVRLLLEIDTDRGAAQKLALGQVDAALIAGPLTGRDQDRGLFGAQVGSYVMAVVTHPQNPVRAVSGVALRQLLTGSLRDWSELGAPACAVVVFALPLGDAIDARNLALAIPGDSLPPEVVRVPDPMAIGRRVQGTPGGFGLVPLGVARAGRMHLIEVDGVTPSQQAAAAGHWPHAVPIVLATRAATTVPADRLAEGLRRSPAWQRALGN